MIPTLIGAILLSLLVVWFVVFPLFSAENMDLYAASYKGFADEGELKQVLNLRDRLVERLVDGRTADVRVAQLSESDCFQALVSLSLRLQRADLPFLPDTVAEQQVGVRVENGGQSGRVQLKVLVFVVIVLLPLIFVVLRSFAPVAWAQAENPEQNSQPSATTPQATLKTPQLHTLENGVYVTTSNRYIVSPAQASVVAQQISSFSVPDHQGDAFRVVLALPEEIYDWQLVEVRPEVLAKELTVTNWRGLPAVQMPSGLQGAEVSFSSEFKLSAPSGRAVWKNDVLPPLPGEQVAILFEVPAILKRIFGTMADNWNVWPPRLRPANQGVQVIEREIAMGNVMPRKVQLVSRMGQGELPFLKFEIIGLVPSRTPLIILAALVGALLAGIALTVFKRGSRWRIDAPNSLPS
jgi:hypothetical protein